VNDRIMPQDRAAEEAVVGSMLLSGDAINDVLGEVFGPDFYWPHHEAIFDVIVDLHSEGSPVDPITVLDRMRRDPDRMKMLPNGPLTLNDLAASVGATASAAYYADIVHGLAMKRRVIEAGLRVVNEGYSEKGSVETLDAAQQALNEVEQMQTRGEDYKPVADLLEPTLDEVERIEMGGQARGVATGFIDLDDLTGGLHKDQMIVVAGRPGSGKSTLALDFVRHAAIRGQTTSVFYSLEMNQSELTMRLLSAESRVPLAKIRGGHLGDEDWTRMAQHLDSIGGAPLFIDDSPNLTMTEIRAKSRKLKRTHDLGLIVIDYMQLMTSGRKVESRQVEVSEFSRQIKLMAKELHVPVVALSQLNRGPEQRSNRRPAVSDLRESGSIEQDSDVVILVHRDDMYEAESTRPGEADLIVGKHRNGPTRDIVVAFQGHYSRFVDLARDFN
jgi:replicative DNA helicase